MVTPVDPRDGDQELLGGGDRLVFRSEVARDAAEALRALTKASRACLLYDAANEAVGRFLAELEGAMRRVLRHGPLTLMVRPFELLHEGEVVYRESDRERSFAFRLHRDGIRELRFDPSVSWDELVRLVGIMTIRFTGVRQQEDDAVTLLWGARMRHLHVRTVHGYTESAEEDRRQDPGTGRARIADLVDAAAAAEPPPSPAGEVAPRHRPITEAERQQLLAEVDGAQLPEWCVRMARHLAAAVGDSADPIDAALAAPMVTDLARVLLDGGYADQLAAVADQLGDLPGLLTVFADPDLMDRLTREVLEGRLTNRALEPVLSHGPPAAVRNLLLRIDRVWRTVPEERRRPLVAKLLAERAEDVIAVAPRLVPELRTDLLEAVADRDPAAAVPLALELVGQPSPASRRAALAALERAPYSAEIGKALVQLLTADDDPELRLRTATVLARHRERRAYDVLVAALERGASGGASLRELRVLAEAAAAIDPRAAGELFRSWVRPKGLMSRLRASGSPLWWPALFGLARIPGTESEEAIRWLSARTDGEFRTACERVLAARGGGTDLGGAR